MNNFVMLNNLSMLLLGMLFYFMFIASAWICYEGIISLSNNIFIIITRLFMIILGCIGILISGRLLVEWTKLAIKGWK